MKLKRHTEFLKESSNEIENEIDSNLLDIIKGTTDALGEYNITRSDDLDYLDDHDMKGVYDVNYVSLKDIKIEISIQNKESSHTTGIYTYDNYNLDFNIEITNSKEFISSIYDYLFLLYEKVIKYKKILDANPGYVDQKQDELYGNIVFPDFFLNSNYFKSKKPIKKFNL